MSRNDDRSTVNVKMPQVVDRETWQGQIDALLIIKKGHTREGDAIAAARRRLPMVEVDANIDLVGANGPVTLLDTFEGRRQLVAYYHMFFPGEPAAEQCEGVKAARSLNNVKAARFSTVKSESWRT